MLELKAAEAQRVAATAKRVEAEADARYRALLLRVSRLPPSHHPAAPDAADVFPCTHCKETLTAANCSHCLYPPCRAPFHTPATGCRLPRVLVVDTVQLYCSALCAQRNNAVAVRTRTRTRRQAARRRFYRCHLLTATLTTPPTACAHALGGTDQPTYCLCCRRSDRLQVEATYSISSRWDSAYSGFPPRVGDSHSDQVWTAS